MTPARGLLTGVLALGLLLASASTASADHHFMKIREFYPGLAAVPQDGFLELQMWAAGQNQTGGHHIQVYPEGSGAADPNFTLTPAVNPPNGESQRTILIGGLASGLTNQDYTEDLTESASFDPTGGALCFVSSEGFGNIDCVEWGDGNTNVSADPPVLPAGIPDGSSITRSISPGCATLLEFSDDTNSSAADFSQAAPTPRGNTDPITEMTCTTTPPPGGGSTVPASPPKPKKKCKKGQKLKKGKCVKKKRKK